MPRMSKGKFGDHENSIASRLHLDYPSDVITKYYWNRKTYFEEFYLWEAWAAMGFMSGYRVVDRKDGSNDLSSV